MEARHSNSALSSVFDHLPAIQSNCSQVHVLLVSWEGEENDTRERRELAQTFEEDYGFNVVQFLIPSQNSEDSQLRLVNMIDAGWLRRSFAIVTGRKKLPGMLIDLMTTAANNSTRIARVDKH